jgi:hypothetical protein
MIDDNKNEIDISKNISKTLSVVTGMTHLRKHVPILVSYCKTVKHNDLNIGIKMRAKNVLQVVYINPLKFLFKSTQ